MVGRCIICFYKLERGWTLYIYFCIVRCFIICFNIDAMIGSGIAVQMLFTSKRTAANDVLSIAKESASISTNFMTFVYSFLSRTSSYFGFGNNWIFTSLIHPNHLGNQLPLPLLEYMAEEQSGPYKPIHELFAELWPSPASATNHSQHLGRERNELPPINFFESDWLPQVQLALRDAAAAAHQITNPNAENTEGVLRLLSILQAAGKVSIRLSSWDMLFFAFTVFQNNSLCDSLAGTLSTRWTDVTRRCSTLFAPTSQAAVTRCPHLNQQRTNLCFIWTPRLTWFSGSTELSLSFLK
jgi:hypothetical protein